MELHAQQALTFELRDFWICARSVLSPRLKLPSEWSALVNNLRTYLAFSRKAIGISVETAEPHCEIQPQETVADCAELQTSAKINDNCEPTADRRKLVIVTFSTARPSAPTCVVGKGNIATALLSPYFQRETANRS